MIQFSFCLPGALRALSPSTFFSVCSPWLVAWRQGRYVAGVGVGSKREEL
jgi:hypothetical protein